MAEPTSKPFIPSNVKVPANDPANVLRAKIAAGDAKIGVVAMSIGEGAGVTKVLVNGWPARLRDKLRQGTPGGQGYQAARYQFANLTPRPNTQVLDSYYNQAGQTIDQYSGANGPYRSTQWGLGRRSIQLTQAGIFGRRFSFTGTSFKLAWKSDQAGTSIRIIIDNGAPVIVTADAANERTYTSPALTAGVHNVKVEYVSGKPYIEGDYSFNGDEGGGIQVYESGQSGSMAYQFSAANAGGSSTWADALVRFDFDGILVLFGTNEYANNLTPEAYRIGLYNLLKTIEARVAPDTHIRVVGVYRPWFDRAASWADFTTAAQTATAQFAAGSTRTADFFNLDTYIPRNFGYSTADPNVNPYFYDAIHAGNQGHEVIASILAADLQATVA